MDHEQMLRHVARNMSWRIEGMKSQDKLDGKTNATFEDYIAWSLEEVCANDGVVISLEDKPTHAKK